MKNKAKCMCCKKVYRIREKVSAYICEFCVPAIICGRIKFIDTEAKGVK